MPADRSASIQNACYEFLGAQSKSQSLPCLTERKYFKMYALSRASGVQHGVLTSAWLFVVSGHASFITGLRLLFGKADGINAKWQVLCVRRDYDLLCCGVKSACYVQVRSNFKQDLEGILCTLKPKEAQVLTLMYGLKNGVRMSKVEVSIYPRGMLVQSYMGP